MIFDASTSLSMGNSSFVLIIIDKAIPHAICTVITCKDKLYTHINLSHVVSEENGSTIFTKILPVIIEFFLPYWTKTGKQETLQITYKKKVSIILNMPLIWQSKIIIDVNDEVSG